MCICKFEFMFIYFLRCPEVKYLNYAVEPSFINLNLIISRITDNLPCATKFELLETGEIQYEHGYKLGFYKDKTVGFLLVIAVLADETNVNEKGYCYCHGLLEMKRERVQDVCQC